MQCLIEGVRSIAMSQLRLSGTCLPRRQPQSAVMSATHCASLTRSTIDSGEKPPKITECAAPMRAHASIATGSSRNHRHVDRDAIAFLDAELAQAVGEAADLFEQLRVGDRPAVARLAFEVEGDLLAAPGAHVTVEALTETLSSPSANHFANGSFHSSVVVNGFIHSSLRAHSAQKAR